MRDATGCDAEIRFDPSMPDGTPRKFCDTSLIRSLGWTPQIALNEGLRRTVEDFRAASAAGRLRG